MVKKETIDSLIFEEKGKTWKRSLINELVLLVKGRNFCVKITDTIDFIPRSEITKGQDTTYTNFFCDYRPLKYKPDQIRLVIGGKKLMYEEDYGATADSLLETKLLINSVISDTKQGSIF